MLQMIPDYVIIISSCFIGWWFGHRISSIISYIYYKINEKKQSKKDFHYDGYEQLDFYKE